MVSTPLNFMRLKPSNAFTLVELLISAFILLVGICGMLFSYVHFMKSSQVSWDMTVASNHVESILEEMQTKPRLQDVISTDWDEWAQKMRLKTLPGEIFSVTYTDPSADPLDIQLAARWQRGNDGHGVSLRTALTK